MRVPISHTFVILILLLGAAATGANNVAATHGDPCHNADGSPCPPPPPPCPAGQHLEGDRCVPDATAPPACPADHHLEGTQCVPNAPPPCTDCPPPCTDCPPPCTDCPPPCTDCPPPCTDCPPPCTDCPPPCTDCPPPCADCPPPCPPEESCAAPSCPEGKTCPPPCDAQHPCSAPPCPEDPCAPACEPDHPCSQPPCAEGRECPPPCAPDAGCAPPCAPDHPCAPPPCGDGQDCPPPCSAEHPCAPPCEPDAPCDAPRPPKPEFCDDNGDGSMTCSPPPQCDGRAAEDACAPPPWCDAGADGRYVCKPDEAPAHAEGCAPDHPCGPPPPECTKDDAGRVVCAPPPGCGGAAFGGAGGQGCAPPEFCKPTEDGRYECMPPQDCRKAADGTERCFEAPTGAACERHLGDAAKEGAFVPCAKGPELFCPPGEDCRTPPAPPPRFCEKGVDDDGRPCALPPRFAEGHYVPPADAHADCVMPPPGEWPPAQPAPEGKVYCPPPGFAPPPLEAEGFEDWKRFAKERAPSTFVDRAADQGKRLADLDEEKLKDMHQAGLVKRLHAPPAFDGRVIDGAFVASDVDAKLAFANFSVGGKPFFQNVRPDITKDVGFSTASGSAVFAASDEAVVEAHNVPSGILGYRAPPGGADFGVGFDLAHKDANVTPDPDGGLVLIEHGTWRGILLGDIVTDETGALRANVKADKPAFFMAIPPEGIETETRLDIARAVARGDLFAEVSLLARDGDIADDVTLYRDHEAFRLEVLEAAEDAIEVEVGGEGDGAAFVLTVDRDTLTTPLADLVVTMDGVEMRECASLDEATRSASKGGCFHLAADDTVLRVTVTPEHFSTHVVRIGGAAPAPDTTSASGSDDAATEEPTTDAAPGEGTEAPATETPSSEARTPGPGLVVALVGLAIAALATRRPRK